MTRASKLVLALIEEVLSVKSGLNVRMDELAIELSQQMASKGLGHYDATYTMRTVWTRESQAQKVELPRELTREQPETKPITPSLSDYKE